MPLYLLKSEPERWDLVSSRSDERRQKNCATKKFKTGICCCHYVGFTIFLMNMEWNKYDTYSILIKSVSLVSQLISTQKT